MKALEVGQRLSAGRVELEVSTVCEPCALMEKIRSGLMAAWVGRRGMMCPVLRGGTLKKGDEIRLASE